jgi:hypothetical protein
MANAQTDGFGSGPIAVEVGRHYVYEQVGYNGDPINGFTDGTQYISNVECKIADATVAAGGPASLAYGENLTSSVFDVGPGQAVVCTFTNEHKGLTALSPANVWIGLKSSDDVGTNFDLEAAVHKNGSLIGSGTTLNVSGGSTGFSHAINDSIVLALTAPTTFGSGDKLSIKLSVRVGATGHRSGTARLWYNDTQANSEFDATISGTDTTYYLRDGFLLATSWAPVTTTSKKTVDVFVDRLVGGNPFKPFGTWTTP